MLPEGEQIVAALSVRPSHFCPEHIFKSIEDNLMKLDTLIEWHNAKTITMSTVFTLLLPCFIFAIKSLSGTMEINET